MNSLNIPIFDPAWSYTETEFCIQNAACRESLFAVGNGYLGVRGYFDEGYPETIAATSCSAFLNGVYESLPIEYDESAYGFAQNCHRIIDVPRHKFLILLDGEPFNFSCGNITHYQRVLDFKSGTLNRFLVWRHPGGKKLALQFERTALASRQNIMLARLTVTALNFSGKITVHSVLSAEYQSQADINDPRRGGKVPNQNWLREKAIIKNNLAQYQYRAKNSGIQVAVSLQSATAGNGDAVLEASGDCLKAGHCISLSQGDTGQVVSILSYVDSRSHTRKDLLTFGRALCCNAMTAGYDTLMEEQIGVLNTFWQYADIRIRSKDGAQDAIRFALFHLFQSTGRDGLSSIAAKGVTGSGYDGHYFWDAETYVFPFWLFSYPQTARKLLEYRIHTLDAAKRHAREMGHAKGALFAWRTIGGEECSSYFPAGSAQYHINADIAYAARSYIRITTDYTFLVEGLAEMVLETARIWMDLGHFSDQLNGRFGIYGVTGPDEYTAVVNNNYYTNKMAQIHLYWACEIVTILKKQAPEFFESLTAKINLDGNEPSQWQRAAEKMYFSFDAQRNIYAQDDTFLAKPLWNFNHTPQEKYPLLLHFHPLVIYRHQVLKQADTLLALMLDGQGEAIAVKRACYDFYEPITTHDSTLSTCIHSIMAMEVGYVAKAYEYFNVTVRLDLDDAHNNTYYGVHTAAMAGVWMGVVQGFAGLRYGQGELSFNPQLPDQWQTLTFNLCYRQRRIEVRLTKKDTTYRLIDGESMVISHKGASVPLKNNQPNTQSN